MLIVASLIGTALAASIVALCLSPSPYKQYVYTACACYTAFALGFSALAII